MQSSDKSVVIVYQNLAIFWQISMCGEKVILFVGAGSIQLKSFFNKKSFVISALRHVGNSARSLPTTCIYSGHRLARVFQNP